jgi:ABC-type Mn2+/Zn2+ transport system ATPase subunit
MRYEKFRIKNFKGIKETEVDLTSLTGANVFPFVALNESGKTTLLEAIHSFAPDYRSGRIVNATSGTDQERAVKRVPRHLLASFTGEVTVEAVVLLDPSDRQTVADYLKSEYDLRVEDGSIPDRIAMSRNDVFERGDYLRTARRLDFKPQLKGKGQRNFRTATPQEVARVWEALRESAPDIAYYPTFIFDFPERIYVTARPGVDDWFYKSVIEDILAVDGQGYTLDDLVRRVRAEKFIEPWADFLPGWMRGDDRRKVQQIVDRASSAVTRHVFGKWNKIFGEEVSGKELVIEFDVEEGRKLSPDKKTWIPAENHDIYVWFEIKDGTRRFRVNDRSLGFRWFFAFLLFTQFRVARKSSRSVLFLFDEPAANLHAAAQQKLIESFPEIAGNDNMLVYTTHSHYMIEPAWLEQTFIVTNRSETPKGSIVDSATLDDESLDVQAHRYRKFVNEHPNETSYFQPIVDRLEVVPSKFDYNLPSVVVEGKSDYYIIEYARHLLGVGPNRLIPATGSGTFSALIGLSIGWGIKFLFLLDADHAGRAEKARYGAELGAPLSAITTIDEYVASASEIESLIDVDAIEIIKGVTGISGKPTKKQLQQFFQEQLAKGSLIDLGPGFKRDAGALLKGLDDKLSSL